MRTVLVSAAIAEGPPEKIIQSERTLLLNDIGIFNSYTTLELSRMADGAVYIEGDCFECGTPCPIRIDQGQIEALISWLKDGS